MVAINMNFSNIPPSSGGGQSFPPSPPNGWLVKIVAEEMKEMKQGQGNRLIFKMVGLEGEVNGRMGENGYNIQHPKQETVNIAWQEISSVGWACGFLNRGNQQVNDTTQLFEKPFRIIVVQSADPRYTEVVGYRTPDGQDPAKVAAGQGGAGPTNTGGGMPQGQNPNGGGFGPGQGQGNGGGWGPQGGGNAQPQGQGPQGGGNGGWGGPQGQNNGQPQGNQGQGNNGGWSGPNGGQGNGQPQQGQGNGGGGWGGPNNGQPQNNGGGWGGGNGGGNNGGWGGPNG